MMCSLTRTWGRRRMWWVRSVRRGWLAPYWRRLRVSASSVVLQAMVVVVSLCATKMRAPMWCEMCWPLFASTIAWIPSSSAVQYRVRCSQW